MSLTPTQERLLRELAERSCQGAPDRREFLLATSFDGTDVIFENGAPGLERISQADFDELVDQGFIRTRFGSKGSTRGSVTNAGRVYVQRLAAEAEGHAVTADKEISDLLELLKDKHHFPPYERVTEIKNALSVTYGLSSGAVAEEIIRAHREAVEAILNEFAETAIRNADKLGLTSDVAIETVVSSALEKLFTEATGLLVKEFGTSPGCFKTEAIRLLEEHRGRIRDRLLRMVRVRHLDFGRSTTPPVQVHADQIGNLVVGPVNQSQLTASLQQIVNQGGPAAEVGRILEAFVELVRQIDDSRKAEREELLDLVKGLTQQVTLPKEERSRGTIRAILARIKEVATAASDLVNVATFVSANLSQLTELFERLT